MQLNIVKGGNMEAKTGNYWQDLNLAIRETFGNIGRYPTKNQQRDTSSFLMHVLENETGINENDLRFRTGLGDRKFKAIKNDLILTELIQSQICYGKIIADNEIVTIKAGENIRHLIRKIYYSPNGNNTLKIHDNAIIAERGSTSIVSMPKKEEMRDNRQDAGKKMPEKKNIEISRRNEFIKPEAKPREPFVVPLIINKGQIREIRELLEANKKNVIEVKALFEKWNLPYSEKSFSTLKFYLEKNNVNFAVEGNFPKLILLNKIDGI